MKTIGNADARLRRFFKAAAVRAAAAAAAIAMLLHPQGAHAWENGGYFVMERISAHGRAGLRAPTPERYREVYADTVGCTFPVSADAGLVDALASGCAPDPRAYLERRYADTRFVLLYVPRTLYDTLYTAYARSNGAPAFAGLREPDRDMLSAWRRHGSLQAYYLELIRSDEVVARHERFNAWAVRWLQQRADAAGIDAHDTAAVRRLAAPQLRTIAEAAVALLQPRRPDVVDIVSAQIEREHENDEFTYLFKPVDDEAAFMRSALVPVAGEAPAPLQVTSIGFSAGLYAGMWGDRRADCVYCELDSNYRAHTVMRVPVRLQRPFGIIAEMMHVPALPPVLVQHLEHSALAHPRTRLFATERPLAVAGVPDGTLRCAIAADPAGWKAAGWLALDRKARRALDGPTLLRASARFMQRIAEQATVLAEADERCITPVP